MRLNRMLATFSIWLLSLVATASSGLLRMDEVDQVTLQPGMYFRESRFGDQYDERFANHPLDEADQKAAARVLIQTYLATFRDLGIETWIMHGTLLGWWWNKKALPWDNDADVMITEPSIYYLAKYHNMTTYFYKYSAIPEGRSFLLDINPHYKDRSEDDKLNLVDARWIDTENGLFIDITTARYNLTHPEGEGVMTCKDGHEFRDVLVFPLIETKFEGVDIKIPSKYRDFLVSEYGESALTNKEFHGYHFDDEKLEWLSDKGSRADL